MTQPVKSKTEYRCNLDSWTDDDASTSGSSSSSDSDAFFRQMHEEKSRPKKLPPLKTEGKLDLYDLPPVENLTIAINEGEMMHIGKVHAVIDTLVVVRALKGMKPLDLDSVLFLSHDQPLGRIFDVFGPVSEPFYCVQHNSQVIQVGTDVFFAPQKKGITTYVFLEKLQNEKGSDASWKHDDEPPEEILDYSDDEEERKAKARRRTSDRHISPSHAKRPFLEGGSVSLNHIPLPHSRPAPPCNTFQNISLGISRPNLFQSRIPPAFPSPPVFMSPVRIPNAYDVPAPYQPRQVVVNQHIFSPLSQMLYSYQQLPIFGQTLSEAPREANLSTFFGQPNEF